MVMTNYLVISGIISGISGIIVTFFGSSSDRKCVKLVETPTLHFA